MGIYAVLELGGNLRHNIQWLHLFYLFGVIGWRNRHKWGELLWFGYAGVALALWAFGLEMSLSKKFFPVAFALMFIWWIAVTRPWRELSRVFQRPTREDAT